MNTSNTSNTSPLSPEPLSPEEREFVARLAQLGPHGTPPPALDATIIAAAHAAATGQVRPPGRRWPALLGLAATLALAIGVTWQMQPGGEVASRDDVPRERASAVASEAAADSAKSTVTPAGKQAPRLSDDLGQSGEEAVPMRVLAPAAAEPDLAPAALPDKAKARAAVSAIPTPPPPLPQPAPAAAPPAPPQSPLVAEQAIDAASPAQAQRESMTRRRPESRAESNAAPAPMDRAVTTAGTAAVVDDLAAVPVARDGELEPADWLERIRLRRDAGDLAGARESLELLRRAYPQTVLPDDLRNLAESQLDRP